ncbi:MAG: response regulator transcription factor [Bacteroidetes bacterium]|nr:response regulator transcription factor [Bacteroidota bacterium]
MLKTILIDDEQGNISSLQLKLGKYCPEAEIVATCDTAEKGIVAIESLQPDLVFLDIEMPVMNGFVMLQQLEYKNFALVFVTAYDHYAIKAIRFSALDYLVKPVEIDDLKAAVQRAGDKKRQHQAAKQMELLLENITPFRSNFNRLALPAAEGIKFIKTSDIIYLEASVNYTHIFMNGGKKYTLSRTLKDVEDVLDTATFVRIHNSTVVNKNFVESYIRGEGGQVVMNNGTVLDVSKRKKPLFLKAMGE